MELALSYHQGLVQVCEMPNQCYLLFLQHNLIRKLFLQLHIFNKNHFYKQAFSQRMQCSPKSAKRSFFCHKIGQILDFCKWLSLNSPFLDPKSPLTNGSLFDPKSPLFRVPAHPKFCDSCSGFGHIIQKSPMLGLDHKLLKGLLL